MSHETEELIEGPLPQSINVDHPIAGLLRRFQRRIEKNREVAPWSLGRVTNPAYDFLINRIDKMDDFSLNAADILAIWRTAVEVFPDNNQDGTHDRYLFALVLTGRHVINERTDLRPFRVPYHLSRHRVDYALAVRPDDLTFLQKGFWTVNGSLRSLKATQSDSAEQEHIKRIALENWQNGIAMGLSILDTVIADQIT